uniref:hypothetical protein n=1 Tax=Rhodobacter capsulatus TaxID=1061 RepID=UPI0020168DFE|nr:hypothetical protein [Rhodobacter capsulatus]
MLSLPLAIGGAIFALSLYGAGIGLSVVIGLLMLMGIAAKTRSCWWNSRRKPSAGGRPAPMQFLPLPMPPAARFARRWPWP